MQITITDPTGVPKVITVPSGSHVELSDVYQNCTLRTRQDHIFAICQRDLGLDIGSVSKMDKPTDWEHVYHAIEGIQPAIPKEAHDLEVFEVRDGEAFIGYKLGMSFHYIQVPATRRRFKAREEPKTETNS